MTELDKPAPIVRMGRRRVGDQAADGLLYDRVERDELLSPYFPGGVSEKHRAGHRQHLVVRKGGPARYTQDSGRLREHARSPSWPCNCARGAASLRLSAQFAADDAGLPDDPEFRSALVAYAERGPPAMHNPPDAQGLRARTGPLAGAGVRGRQP